MFGAQTSEQMQEGRVYLLVALWLWLCLCVRCGCLCLEMRQYRAFVAFGPGTGIVIGIVIDGTRCGCNALVPLRIRAHMHLTARLLCLLVKHAQDSHTLIAVLSRARRVARERDAFAKGGNALIG